MGIGSAKEADTAVVAVLSVEVFGLKKALRWHQVLPVAMKISFAEANKERLACWTLRACSNRSSTG